MFLFSSVDNVHAHIQAAVRQVCAHAHFSIRIRTQATYKNAHARKLLTCLIVRHFTVLASLHPGVHLGTFGYL